MEALKITDETFDSHHDFKTEDGEIMEAKADKAAERAASAIRTDESGLLKSIKSVYLAEGIHHTIDEDDLEAAHENLLWQYEKLYMLDEHYVVYLDANEKRGRPVAIRFNLNEAQKERINLVAGAIGTPDPALWQKQKGSQRCTCQSDCPAF